MSMSLTKALGYIAKISAAKEFSAGLRVNWTYAKLSHTQTKSDRLLTVFLAPMYQPIHLRQTKQFSLAQIYSGNERFCVSAVKADQQGTALVEKLVKNPELNVLAEGRDFVRF